jgi:hypothetical protein
MITNYTPVDNTFNTEVYIFSSEDFVLGELDGTSNIPLKQIAENTAYLKRFKGRIIYGTGTPSTGSIPTDMVLDSYSIYNVLYLDETTGSFWKLTSISPITWSNITKSTVLNVAGLKINNAGNDAEYFEFKYNSTTNTLELLDSYGNYGNVKVGTVYYNTIDSRTITDIEFVNIVDSELLLLANIEDESQNQDAFFSVKRLEDISEITVTSFYRKDESVYVDDTWYVSVSSGTVLSDYISDGDYVEIQGIDEESGEEINGYYKVSYVNDALNYFRTSSDFRSAFAFNDYTGLSGTMSKDNSAQIRWNATDVRWELKTRNGNLLPLQISNFINESGIPVGFIADRVISTTSQFDALFNNVVTGEDVCYLRKPETNYTEDIENEFIYIKPNSDVGSNGEYTLNNMVQIMGSNIKIETTKGTKINTVSGAGFRMRNEAPMIVNPNVSYTSTIIEIQAENARLNSEAGNREGDLVVMETGDTITLFSETSNVNGKYHTTSIDKRFSSDIDGNYDQITIGGTTSDQHVVKYEDELFHTYVDSGLIYVRKYVYNNTTKQYDIDILLGSSTSGTFSHPKLFVDNINVYLCYFDGSNSIRFVYFDKNTAGSANISTSNQAINSSGTYDYPKFIVSSGYAYVLGYSSTPNITLYKYNIYTHAVSSISSNVGDVNNYVICDNDDDVVFITSLSGTYNIRSVNKSTFTTVVNHDSISAGNFYEMYLIPYSTSIYGCYRDTSFNIHFISFTTAYSSFNDDTLTSTIASSPISMVINTENTYPEEDTVEIIISYSNGLGILLTRITNDYGNTWISTSTDCSFLMGENYISTLQYGNAKDDYIYLIIENGVFNITYLLKIHRVFYIQLASSIPTLSLSDLIVSHDYLENIELKLNIDNSTNSNIYDIRLSNSIYSLFNCIIEGSFFTVLGEQTYSNTIKIIDELTTETYIDTVLHSSFRDCNVHSTYSGGTLNNCLNCNFIGFINNEANIINGDINE